jgi:hypothetical protein
MGDQPIEELFDQAAFAEESAEWYREGYERYTKIARDIRLTIQYRRALGDNDE